jgi:hypothetical protein
VADVAENFRKFLLDDTAIGPLVGLRAAQNSVPQGKKFPFLWLQIIDTIKARCLGETSNTPLGYILAVECISDDLDEAESLAVLVNARCESAACGSQAFGNGTVSNVFCESQADDYIPKGADLSSGEHVAALQVEVYP